ncbi:MAG: hypothetical protein QOI41_7372 [Myxococcales bacterium]|nr:hypothetical protein [Myxococcales bacterium]
MASYVDVDPHSWTAVLDDLRATVGKTAALENAAEHVKRALYATFEASTALARVYAVVPYRDLTAPVAAFVDELAAKTGQTAHVRPETPVLTLLATHGRQKDWCDRTKSKGHVAIPLVSAEFVQAIPMVARLLKELGVDLAWLDAATDVNARRLLGGFNGLFFVDDAATARDNLGRLVIPAQDFVEEQDVKTVFGMGGFYPDNTLIVIIVFARETLRRSQVERFTSLISLFKGETFGVVRARKFFS